MNSVAIQKEPRNLRGFHQMFVRTNTAKEPFCIDDDDDFLYDQGESESESVLEEDNPTTVYLDDTFFPGTDVNQVTADILKSQFMTARDMQQRIDDLSLHADENLKIILIPFERELHTWEYEILCDLIAIHGAEILMDGNEIVIFEPR